MIKALRSRPWYAMAFFIGQIFFCAMAMQAGKEMLVDIKIISPNIRVEPRYATARNFAGKPLYEYPGTFLHVDAAKALDAVQKDLEERGLGLLIWDAYRSSEMQQIMWEAACEQGGKALLHVSNPATSPGYKNRGVHVELTLVDKDGNLLEMPTDFDDLGERAHSRYMNLPQHVLANRQIFHDVMAKYGFANFELEWWYFRLKNTRDYEPFEVSLEELKEMAK